MYAGVKSVAELTITRVGYAQRQHISKALKARSPAIKTALEKYNTAARAMSPPRQFLEWQQIVEYAFLADFDLLRDARQDISTRKWATPAGRLAMDTYFKICRAQEEIKRLNVEIPRFVTHLGDEDRYLQVCEEQVQDFDRPLAHQISIRRKEQARFRDHHLRQLAKISQLPGFTGIILPGESLDSELGASATVPSCMPQQPSAARPMDAHNHGLDGLADDTEEDLEEEDVAEDEEGEISSVVHDVVRAMEGLGLETNK